MKSEEVRKAKEEVQAKRGSGQPVQQPLQHAPGLLSKEETEELMEKLVSKVVAKPSLIADDKLNAKIERIFNVDAFQRMVEHVDMF